MPSQWIKYFNSNSTSLMIFLGIVIDWTTTLGNRLRGNKCWMFFPKCGRLYIPFCAGWREHKFWSPRAIFIIPYKNYDSNVDTIGKNVDIMGGLSYNISGSLSSMVTMASSWRFRRRELLSPGLCQSTLLNSFLRTSTTCKRNIWMPCNVIHIHEKKLRIV